MFTFSLFTFDFARLYKGLFLAVQEGIFGNKRCLVSTLVWSAI